MGVFGAQSRQNVSKIQENASRLVVDRVPMYRCVLRSAITLAKPSDSRSTKAPDRAS